MVRLLTCLCLFAALNLFAAITAPTNFRTDPADFSNLALPVGCVQYQFRWTDNANNETRYEMEVSTNGSDFFYEGFRAANSEGYDTANVPWTSNRWYRLRAVNATEQSTYAGPIKCYGYMPPTNLGGSTDATNHMTVTWATAGGYIDGYTVQQDTNTSFTSNLVQYFVTNIASTSYTITNDFELNLTYYFRVVSTNSLVGTGNSEAMNKPRSYISVAPNGPPTAPIFVSEHMDASAGEALILFDDDSLNETGWILQYTTNGGANWYGVTVPAEESTRHTVTHSGLTGGMDYSYRLAGTNSLGTGAYATWDFTPPKDVAAGPTVWYVDKSATAGTKVGTSWANAWTSLGGINWSALGPGHTIYIAGGNYTNYLVTYADGAYGNPIVIKTATNAPYNGRLLIKGGVYWRSSYVTIDGAVNAWVTPINAEAVPANINMEVIANGDDNPVIQPVVCVGAVGRWMELYNAGSPLSGEGSGNGLNCTPTYLGPTNSVFEYLWIHDCFGHIIQQGRGDGYTASASGVVFRYILGEDCHNNFIMGQGWYDMHDCLLRDWKSPGVAHPDGFQGGIQDVRIWNNRWINFCPSGTALYPDISGSCANFYFVNNLLAGPDTACSFALQAGNTAEMVLSNVWFIGNTFYGSNSVYLSLSVNGSLTNRLLKAWRVENNLFYSGTNASAAQGAFSSGLTRYEPADLIFDYNSVCGPEKIISYRTNANVAGADGVFDFPTAEAFNAWSTFYKSNSSAQVQLLREYLGDYSLFGGDTNALNTGTNLSSLASLCSAITNDLNSAARGQGTGWERGAYEHDPSLVLYFDFEEYTNAAGTYVRDLSGRENHGWTVTNRTVTDVGRTNYAPDVTTGKVGNYAANFLLLGTNEQWQVYHADLGYQIGNWFGVTNWNGIDYLTNGTWLCWACYTNADGFGDSTLWSAGWINNPADDNTWDISRYDADNQTLTLFTNATRIKPIAFPNPAVSEWQHVAVTWNATNQTVTGYTNGVPFSTNVFKMPYLHLADSGSHNVIVGASTHGGSWALGTGVPVTPDDQFPNNAWFTGYLDEMRIYNRDLSASEVAAIYAGGAATGGSGSSGSGGGTPASSTVTITNLTIGTLTILGP